MPQEGALDEISDPPRDMRREWPLVASEVGREIGGALNFSSRTLNLSRYFS